jgi:hypothetical protein
MPCQEYIGMCKVICRQHLDSIPQINNVKVGSTDYIDMIHQDDISDDQGHVPIVYFVDRFRRPGLAMRVVIRNEHNAVLENGIYTFFQRYTDGNSFVICASHLTRSTGKFLSLICPYGGSLVSDAGYMRLKGVISSHFNGGVYICDEYKISLECLS